MISHMVRLVLSPPPPEVGGVVVVVVAAWAPLRPLPGISRLSVVVNVWLAARSTAAAAFSLLEPELLREDDDRCGTVVCVWWKVGGGDVVATVGGVVGTVTRGCVVGVVRWVVGNCRDVVVCCCGWVVDTGGPTCADAVPAHRSSATPASTAAVTRPRRASAVRPDPVGLPSSMHSTLSAPAGGKRSQPPPQDCRTSPPPP